jgi:hypothetical protein
MANHELDIHLEEMGISTTSARSDSLDRLESAYRQRNPEKAAAYYEYCESETPDQLTIEEQAMWILDPDQRTSWAKRRRAAREKAANTLEDQALQFMRRNST